MPWVGWAQACLLVSPSVSLLFPEDQGGRHRLRGKHGAGRGGKKARQVPGLYLAVDPKRRWLKTATVKKIHLPLLCGNRGAGERVWQRGPHPRGNPVGLTARPEPLLSPAGSRATQGRRKQILV